MNNNKKNKKPIIALLVVAIVGVIGITFAFFSDKINVNNIFKTKPYGTTVTEVFESPDNWLPGTTSEKVVKVKNSGEVDEAVRISFTEEWKSANGTILSGWVDKDGNVSQHLSNEETDERAAIINFANQADWKISTENGTNYYYYRYKVAKNEETSSFIKSVTFNSSVNSDSNCNEKEENGTKTVTCTSTKKGYDGATYTLSIKIETVQYDKYKEAWNTNVNIREEKGTSLASFVTTNGTKYTGNGSDTYEFDVYFLTDDTNNNVLFANYCWKIVRTTETGGIKLLYNGVPTDGKCNNSGADTTIGKSAFNEDSNSPAYVGYMYNKVYEMNKEAPISGSIFSSDVEFNGSRYTLKEPTTNTLSASNHYTCNNTIGECETVRYYFYVASNYSGSNYYYIELNGTKNIEIALKEMLSNDNLNKTDSNIKSFIDTWYAENLIDYTEYLEDTVFCNDRSISSYGGWNPSEGSLSDDLLFKEYNVSVSYTHLTLPTKRIV